MELCTHYRRGTGFFSSSAFKSYSSSLSHIINDDVKIDILCSPIIQDKSLISTLELNSSSKGREKTIRHLSENVLLLAAGYQLDPERIDFRSKLLSFLIANGQLEIKFVIPKVFDWPTEADNERNIYHVKMGYFKFSDNSTVAFDGSFNESASGHEHHVDRTQVYRSWIDSDLERMQGTIEDINKDWNGENNFISVYPLSEATLDIIKKLSPSNRPRNGKKEKKEDHSTVQFPTWLWQHQRSAVSTFISAKHGILEMATGTGKTTTAIEIIRQLYLTKKIDSIIICTYGNDLLAQWYEEVENWIIKADSISLNKLKTFRDHKTYYELQAFLNNPKDSLLFISREATKLKRLLSNKQIDKNRTLLIHDEIHGFGSPSLLKSLTNMHKGIAYKLGLSATPDREYDKEGSQFIEDEIGQVVYEFPLEKAINEGILCEFNYKPLSFTLTESDEKRRQNVYSRKARSAKEGNPWTKEKLYMELSKVVKKAELKPSIFEGYLSKNPTCLESSIVFVLDKEQGDKICDIVSKYTHRYKTYYAGTEAHYLNLLASKDIDCLIACERLNEGIDIRGLKSVILVASPKTKLDTIQRIGRCLRKDPTNLSKRAIVIDFVLEQDENNVKLNTDNQRKEWLSNIASSRLATKQG